MGLMVCLSRARPDATLSDAPRAHLFQFQELLGSRSSKQSELGQKSRFRAGGGVHGYRSWRIGNRPSCLRIEHVAIADTIPDDVAIGIAAGGERAAREFQ